MRRNIKIKRILIIFAVISGMVLRPECRGLSLNDAFFIGEEPDSAAIGRGLAFTGVIENPSAPYWNPAGLATLKINKIGISANIFARTDSDEELLKQSYPLGGRQINFLSICGPEVGIFWRPLSSRSENTEVIENGAAVNQHIEAKINETGITIAVTQSDRTDFGMNI